MSGGEWSRPGGSAESSPTVVIVLADEKILKNLLTNRLKYGILKVQKARERQSQTGKPTRASKTDSPRPDRTVPLCAEYKCEPDHAVWKNVVDTQGTQATLFHAVVVQW